MSYFIELPDIETKTLDSLFASFKDYNSQKSFLHTIPEGFKHWKNLFAFAIEHSPYLERLLYKEADWLYEHAYNSPNHILESFYTLKPHFDTSIENIMQFLRLVKRRSSLLIALCDLCGWSVILVTQYLSKIADFCVECAMQAALFNAIKRKKLPITEEHIIKENHGLFIYAMGKHGAEELNFSSDIDLSVFFDASTLHEVDPYQLHEGFIFATQLMVKILSERTADGYVYRTDLRLRPDPSSTKVAVPVQAAEIYYEQCGQNWERAAFIKARCIYGDKKAALSFLDFLRPFIWRKNLDYAAIADIHSIKRQINAHYGHDELTVKGHNIKLGYGGIREIELFVQTQQLIGGGRDINLRNPKTLDSLEYICEKGWIDEQARNELYESYVFLRMLEHRLQMVADMQTHEIPSNDGEIDNIIHFCKFKTYAKFEQVVLHHLKQVHRHYGILFEDAPTLAGSGGKLIFTGVDDDPETLKNITKMGFDRPQDISQIIRGWHHGRIAATRTVKAREILTEIVPVLLEKASNTALPDTTILRFDWFMQRLPAGVQIFSMIKANPDLLNFLIEIMGAAPSLAGFLSKNPTVLDAFFDSGFFNLPKTLKDMQEEMQFYMQEITDYESILNSVRRFVREQRFRIGVGILRGIINFQEAGKSLAYLAQSVIDVLTHWIMAEMGKKYQLHKNQNLVIIGMGSLGAMDMTLTSDLDLIMIYDDESLSSDWDIPMIAPQTYFAKLGQKILTALTIQTEEGGLYSVDMRLRPSGNSGPLVCSLKSFCDYQIQKAWTWEKLALMRGRVIYGYGKLKDDVENAIKQSLCIQNNSLTIKKDVEEMRQKIMALRTPKNLWDIKLNKGGLFDLMFVVQTLSLIHAHNHAEILNYEMIILIKNLHKIEAITTEEKEILQKTYKKFMSLLHLISVAIGDVDVEATQIEKAPNKFKNMIAQILEISDDNDKEDALKKLYKQITTVYEKYLKC